MTAANMHDLASLDAYVMDAMDSAEADWLEEAIFGEIATEGADEAALYLALRQQLRALAERGTFDPVLRPDDAEALRATSPLRVAVISVDAPIDREAVLASDILLIRVPLALEDVARIDVETSVADQPPAIYPDVPFDPQANCIWMCCELELALESVAAGAVQRFVAVEGHSRRVLREIRLAEM